VHPSKPIQTAEGRAPAIITFKQRAGPKGYVKVEMSMLAFECMQPTALYGHSPTHPAIGRLKLRVKNSSAITEATQFRTVNRSILVVNDGSNPPLHTLPFSVYGNIRDASMAPKSPPCLSAALTGPANYGVNKEFAELYVGYYPEGLDVRQNEKEGAPIIHFDVSWKLAAKPHPKKRRLDKSTRDLIAVDIQHYGLRELSFHLNPQDIELLGWQANDFDVFESRWGKNKIKNQLGATTLGGNNEVI
jgi:hypothetical protein